MTYGRLKNSIFSKSFKDIKEQGFLYFILKTNRFFYHKYLNKNARRITDKLKNKPQEYFMFNNKKYGYLIHPYNLTWINERTVEVPIVLDFINNSKAEKILEFGAVLLHYTDVNWDVIDKFEKGEKINNIDIVDFKPKSKYDLIVSISTLEHVGFDDEDKPKKIIEAIKILKNSLDKNGKIIVTMPLGYNKFMDNLIYSDKIGFNEKYFLKKMSRKNKWKQASLDEIKKTRYNYPFNNANAVFIGISKNAR
jgi:hypothetical protein